MDSREREKGVGEEVERERKDGMRDRMRKRNEGGPGRGE